MGSSRKTEGINKLTDRTTANQRIRDEFARRLQSAMIEKGWNQTEMARNTALHMPKGQRMERDTISTYIRGKALPTAVKMKAICTALGVDPKDLVPERSLAPGLQDVQEIPTKGCRDIGDGNAWLTINQAVPFKVALQILSMLEAEIE